MTEHKGTPDKCPACMESKRAECTQCGHALTGEFDEHGRTICEVCGAKVWIGVGDAND